MYAKTNLMIRFIYIILYPKSHFSVFVFIFSLLPFTVEQLLQTLYCLYQYPLYKIILFNYMSSILFSGILYGNIFKIAADRN